LPENASVVVSSGRVHSYKGIAFILRLAAELIVSRGRDDLYFVHLGDGPDMDRYRLMAGDLALHGRFIFAGRRSDVRSILPSCTVALHASDGEAFSLAILEFMASGLPPVVPNHCGNAEPPRPWWVGCWTTPLSGDRWARAAG
jgi:glycosyltransferase involved in cell wall biosynthesis